MQRRIGKWLGVHKALPAQATCHHDGAKHNHAHRRILRGGLHMPIHRIIHFNPVPVLPVPVQDQILSAPNRHLPSIYPDGGRSAPTGPTEGYRLSPTPFHSQPNPARRREIRLQPDDESVPIQFRRDEQIDIQHFVIMEINAFPIFGMRFKTASDAAPERIIRCAVNFMCSCLQRKEIGYHSRFRILPAQDMVVQGTFIIVGH